MKAEVSVALCLGVCSCHNIRQLPDVTVVTAPTPYTVVIILSHQTTRTNFVYNIHTCLQYTHVSTI